MLTKVHRVFHWDRRSNSISSDRLEDACVPYLSRGIAVYRRRVGDRLGDVRNAARRALEGLRPDRVEGVINLLDDAATYEWPRGSVQAEHRLRVFRAAASVHPVLDSGVRRALLETAFNRISEEHDESVTLLYADSVSYTHLTLPTICSV